MRLRSLLVATSALLAPITIRPALADVVYQYTGHDFTVVSSPYDTSDYVSISVTLPAPLGPNLNGPQYAVNAPILAYTATDGVQTITGPSGDTTGTFEFSTDGAGTITAWSVTISQDSGGSIVTQYGANFQVNLVDQGTLTRTELGYNEDEIGSWSGPNQTMSTPEPGSLAVIAIALAGLGWTRRQKQS